jgi:CMP-N-acetylneuraminic acid synthetase
VTRVLALIAARAGSKGLAHKNICTVRGVPGLVRAVRLAKRFAEWRVVVSTDDTGYAHLARDAGAEVIMRPAALASDEARLIDVVLHAVAVTPCDVVVLLSATTPLVRTSDVRRAFATWREHAVAVATVTADTPAPLRFAIDADVLHATVSEPPGRRQSADTLYRLNGAVYIATPEWLREHGRFVVAGKSRAVVMPTHCSIDIETASDLMVARAIANTRCRKAPMC